MTSERNLKPLFVVLLFVLNLTVTNFVGAETDGDKARKDIRGKSLDEWITQVKNGPTLEDRHNALQVLRNDGLGHNRKKTLSAFTDALSDKVPTVQSLAAAGLLKAGRPTDPAALPKLVKIISGDLSIIKPPSDEFGLVIRTIRAIEAVGDKHQKLALRGVSENRKAHILIRRFATDAIRTIESRDEGKTQNEKE